MSPSKLLLQPKTHSSDDSRLHPPPVFFFHTQKVHIVQFPAHVGSSKREEVSVPSLRREHESLSVSTSSLIVEFNPAVQIFSPHPRTHLTKCWCAFENRLAGWFLDWISATCGCAAGGGGVACWPSVTFGLMWCGERRRPREIIVLH